MLISELKECPDVGIRVWNKAKTRQGTITEVRNDGRYPGDCWITWDGEDHATTAWWWWDMQLEIVE